MRHIYLDNAATSFPKAPNTASEMARYLTEIGGNLGRGSYSTALDAEMTSITLRERLCALFGSRDAEGCIFTPGATYGLNLVLKGQLRSGDHVLVSSLEHNAVMRPLHQIGGLDIEKLPCAPDGTTDASEVERRIRPNTRLVCMTHASNVCGTILPIAAIGSVCRKRHVPFVVDAAQSAGHLPIDCARMGIDALILPAHKGLLGPQGIGAVLMTRAFAEALPPFVTGGTGSRSDQERQPLELPDKFEAGTQNIPAMYGWLAALDFVEPRMEALQAAAMSLCARFLDGLHALPHVRILGRQDAHQRVAVIAVDFEGLDNARVSDRLAREFGVSTRCGLHCAPSAHHALGSYPQGAVRFSVGAFNTSADIDETLQALRIITRD